MDYNVNAGRLVSVSIGLLFIVLGNYMGQIRHNYFFGIRNPWTLASDKVWVKTHRRGGWLFIILGLIFIITGFINQATGFWVSIAFLLVFIVYINVYSYLEFKGLENK